MKNLSPSRALAWAFIILLGMAVLLPAQRLPAQEEGCIAVDRHDLPRPCTFLEEHGGCLWNAFESYDACKEDADGLFQHLACELGVQVDLLACNLGLPWRLIKSIID